MTQYARPDSDISIASWTDRDEEGSDLFSFIDESSVDDNDYIYLDLMEEDFDPVIFGTSNVTDPESSSDHKVTFRGRADGPGTEIGGTMQAKLLVGGSVVATDSVRDMPIDQSWETFVWNLSTSQANAISSYTDLRISLTATDPNTTNGVVYCSWLFFECPDAAAPSATTSPAFLLFVDP